MKLRDSFHIFIGFAIMYLIGSVTDFAEFTLDGKIIGVPIASAFIGTFAGGLFSLWFPDIKWLMISTCIISMLLVLNDLKYFLKK